MADDAPSPLVLLERRDDGVAVVRLNSGKLNPLSQALLTELHAIADDLRADPPGAVVVTGNERAFAAGAEIAEFGGPEEGRVIGETFHGDSDAARLAIAGFLVIGAILLWLADRLGRRTREIETLNAPTALTIGFSQALALFPGISRSGATLTTGLALGLTRESAARFSFLLAVPITLGAGIYGSRHLLTEAHTGVEWLAIGVGFAAAAISGMLAIGFLLSWLRHRSVTIFSVYRIVFAAFIVWLVFIGH